jgi:cytochrome c6
MVGRQLKNQIAILAALAFGFLLFSPRARASDDKTAKLFEAKCSVCHGDDGHGTDIGRGLNVVDLHSPEVQKQTDDQLIAAVTNGKNKMPPNKGKLTAAQIKSLVGYVRELGKQK